ncbi:FecR domain-containing protein [Marinobacter sp. M3C]|uniref:FecR family protein n=1 Tax=Marinobacter sp. M3C TaxID=2917715 RepID=UPI00200DD249|nr:FecR domain-containing protein [Marinobacter sp. M3C]UQG61333.1 FecR domain-containing protein [Marinobacter sp. M3C]
MTDKMLRSSILIVRILPLFLVALLSNTSVQAHLPLAMGSGVSANSSGTALAEWVYTLQKGDSVQQLATQLLAPPYNAQQLLKHNSLNNALLPVTGEQVRIPMDWLKRQPQPARATSVSGLVQLLTSNGQRRPLTVNTLIRAGDELLSGSGRATVILAEGSEIRLSPNSRLAFNRMTQFGKPGMIDTRLRLNRGEVITRVKYVVSGGSRFEIETPSATAAVNGTQFAIQANAGGTGLQVMNGQVEFSQQGRSVEVPAGYGAHVAAQPGGNVRLHKLASPPIVTGLPSVLRKLPAELQWQSLAKTYKLDIFDIDSGRWVDSRTLADDRFDISRLNNGRYEIQLAALDYQGIKGLPAVVPFSIDLQARAAELLEPANGTTTTNQPEFSWSLNGDSEIAQIQISARPQFEDLIATSDWAQQSEAQLSRPLSPGQYYWRVKTEAGGDSTAISNANSLVVDGSLPPVSIISVNYLDQQVRIFWESVETASKYRMQLSAEPDFYPIIKEADIPGTTAGLRLIPGKRYFVRLKALSDGALASRWGPARELYID